MRRGRAARWDAAAGLIAAGLALWTARPTPVAGQEEQTIEVRGLLRVGFRSQADSTAGGEGFRLYESRIRMGGRVGILFDYYTQLRYNSGAGVFQLWDARLERSIVPELEVMLGLFKPMFSLEATRSRDDITFIERSQAATALAPGRQLGAQLGGEALDGRLTYGAGIFNGNGRAAENDGDGYMFTSRLQFNSIGAMAFYDDFVLQAGASLGYSSDEAAPLGKGLVTGSRLAAPHLASDFAGQRRTWGADLQLSYRDWKLTGEYLRADYELNGQQLAPGAEETEAYGGYVELGYRAWGALEGVARLDGFQPALGARRDYLVFGLNLYPDFHAKLGLQYAAALDDSPAAATLADGELSLLAQVGF